MKLKRMPVFSSNLSSPIFMILATFFMCGAIVGAFSSLYTPDFEVLGYEYQVYPKTVFLCFVDAVKFNFLLIIFSRFLGFLIPIYVLARGYLLSFSISVIYSNSGGFFDKSLLFESISYDFFAIPCFLIIATICFNMYGKSKSRGKSGRKTRRYSTQNYNYSTVFALIMLNFGWNIVCMSIF
ncbi:MAG: hypothetical protein R3Y09_04725 [Clostridia bacterium]